ncbi:MAG: rhodanese-like domain-containing protein [Cytophagales bacterium]|nr:MAG: rhodanese-like domain-containing protein [Cytophagales bacterium]TAF62050.1 MAG: rhodanese-like domain-containing protein [Cytophagales bacterium]
MKRFTLTTLLALCLLAACNNSQTTTEDTATSQADASSSASATTDTVDVTNVTKFMTPSDFSQTMFLATKKQLIDVRTEGEYNQGKITSAVNINIESTDFDQKIAALNKNTPTFVYCQSGVRSKKALEKLAAAGFTKLFMLEGGIDAWNEAKLPLQLAI